MVSWQVDPLSNANQTSSSRWFSSPTTKATHTRAGSVKCDRWWVQSKLIYYPIWDLAVIYSQAEEIWSDTKEPANAMLSPMSLLGCSLTYKLRFTSRAEREVDSKDLAAMQVPPLVRFHYVNLFSFHDISSVTVIGVCDPQMDCWEFDLMSIWCRIL